MSDEGLQTMKFEVAITGPKGTYRDEEAVDLVGRNAYDQALRLQVHKRFRVFTRCLAVDESHSWIYTVAVAADYSPVQIVRKTDYELRMRVVCVSAGTGKVITMFDSELGQVLRRIELPGGPQTVVNSISMSAPPTQAKLSPLVAVGTNQGFLLMYDIMSGLQLYEKISETFHGSSISKVLIYEGIRSIVVVAAGMNVSVWEFQICRRQDVLSAHESDVNGLAICARPELEDVEAQDSILATVDSVGHIYLYDLFNLKPIRDWKGHEGAIYSIVSCVHVEYCLLITAGLDSIIKIWDADTGELQRELPLNAGPINSLACFHGIHFPALISAGDDAIIRIWNLLSGDLLFSLSGHTEPIKAVDVTFAPHFTIISGGYDNTTRVWDLELSNDTQIKEACDSIGILGKKVVKVLKK